MIVHVTRKPTELMSDFIGEVNKIDSKGTLKLSVQYIKLADEWVSCPLQTTTVPNSAQYTVYKDYKELMQNEILQFL